MVIILIILIILLILNRNKEHYYLDNFDINTNYIIYNHKKFNISSNEKIINVFYSYVDNNKDNKILDYGSGNGYFLLLLNKYFRFSALYGVEINEELYNLSQQNIFKYNQLDKIKIKNIDAVDYKVPKDVNFIYFHNPFCLNLNYGKISWNEIKIYKKVINNIKASLSNSNKKTYIIFCNIFPFHDSGREIFKLFRKNFKFEKIYKFWNSKYILTKTAVFTI